MRHSEETKQQARELCAQGLSRNEVGRRLGVPPQTVGRWVNPEVAERNRERNSQRLQENPEAAERKRETNRQWRQENPEYSSRWRQENQERYRESIRRWQQENPEKMREYSRQWRQKNPEHHRAYSRRWRQENPERKRENNHRWAQENPERHRENSRRWKQENPEKVREHKAFRRAAQRQATPPWLTAEHRKQMTALHAKARRLEKRTGVQHHVDHIIPLHAKFDGRGKQIACGLHVPWNLKVMPGPDNCSKNCKLPDAEHWTAPGPCGIMKESQGKP